MKRSIHCALRKRLKPLFRNTSKLTGELSKAKGNPKAGIPSKHLENAVVARALNRRFSSFVGADSNNLINCADKNFSVADLSGTSRSDDSFYGPLNPYVRYDYLKFDLWQKIGGIFGALRHLRMSLLTAKAFNFANGHPFNPNRNQRIFTSSILKGLTIASIFSSISER